MTTKTLKQYLKDNGFKTRFLNGSRTNFYVYYKNENGFKKFNKLIYKGYKKDYQKYSFRYFMLGNFKLLVKFD